VDDVMFISLTITCDQQRSVVLSDLQQTLVPSVRPTRQLEIRADTKIRSLDGRRSHWSSRRPALFFFSARCNYGLITQDTLKPGCSQVNRVQLRSIAQVCQRLLGFLSSLSVN